MHVYILCVLGENTIFGVIVKSALIKGRQCFIDVCFGINDQLSKSDFIDLQICSVLTRSLALGNEQVLNNIFSFRSVNGKSFSVLGYFQTKWHDLFFHQERQVKTGKPQPIYGGP